jgi:hypothetical protein
MIGVLIHLLVLVLVLGVVWWVVTLLPVPPPGLKIVQAILVVIFVIGLVDILLGFSGVGLLRGPYLR